MKKYRIRLISGRVIGPLDIAGIIELIYKQKIHGDEEVQIYPTGDWKKTSEFPEIKVLFQNEQAQENIKGEDATFIKKITDLKSDVDKVEIDDDIVYPQKFIYEKKTPFVSRRDKNEKLYETEFQSYKNEKCTLNNSETPDKNSEKTIISPHTQKYLEELKRQKELEQLESEEVLKSEEVVTVDLKNDATQIVSLELFKESIKKGIETEEKKLFLEEKRYKEQIKKESELISLDETIEENEADVEKSQKQKRAIVSVILALIFLYALFFPDSGEIKPKPIVPIYPSIVFPQRYDIPSKEKAIQAHDAAVKLLKKETKYGPTYVDKIKAAKLLRQSAENMFNENTALGRLIFIYSELLDDSKTEIEDANTIFKLVQIFKTKAISDPLYATGIALFYLKIQKEFASVKVVEKFNAVKKNNPTLELFAVYLKGLIATGDLVKAQSVVEKILTVDSKKRSLFVNLSVIDYYLFIANYQKSSEIIASLLKKFPNSVPLLLRSSKLLVYDEDFKSLSSVLKKIRDLTAESSKVYYSKYLEYRALEAVHKKQIKKATSLFKKALTMHESLELRSRLASLNESTDAEANNLITESKAMQLITSSLRSLKQNNWKYAFKDALEATRIAPNYIQAKLHLARLQIEQSLFAEAINGLEKMYKDDPHNEKIIFTLMDAYIKAYKFSDVQRLFTITATSEIRNNPTYYSLMARYYVYKNEFKNAVSWLQLAINKNPLDDNNIYELAKMFIKYSKYEKGKMLLNRAMDLDPANVNYRVSFSEILYEMDGSDAAIGYLYDVLQDFPDHPKLLSQIGIYHYRSGQQKSFENIKDKLKNLPHRDTSLYEFLIKAAKLDSKPEDVIENSKKLIELDPGDLKTRLELGKIYMETNRYKEALIEFKAIEERLETYPKLQYYMSKLFLLTDNNEKAVELAQKEINANPSLEDGHILLGDIYRKEKEFLKAETEYKKAQKINGENVDMLIGLATVNFKKSQYEIALDLFKRARNNDPSRPEIYKLLGDAYRKTSQSTLAVETYKMFLELSPNTKYKDEIETYIRMME